MTPVYESVSVVSVIDHAAPENPPLVIVEGATVTATDPLGVVNELGLDGYQPVAQSTFDLTSSEGTATFVSTVVTRWVDEA